MQITSHVMPTSILGLWVACSATVTLGRSRSPDNHRLVLGVLVLHSARDPNTLPGSSPAVLRLKFSRISSRKSRGSRVVSVICNYGLARSCFPFPIRNEDLQQVISLEAVLNAVANSLHAIIDRHLLFHGE